MLRRPQADVVDLDAGTILRATRDGDFELPGQVGVLAISREEGRYGLGHRERGDDLLLVDAGDGARADIAGRITTGLHRGQPDVPETLPNPGDVGDADPMELNILPRREVGVAVPEDGAVVGALGEGVGRHPDFANLRRRHDAAGDLDPHHESVATLALGIHADPLEAFELPRHLVDGVHTLLRIRVDDGLGDLEGMPRQLQLLGGVELTDVPVRPNELQSAVASAAELHPVRIVQVAWH